MNQTSWQQAESEHEIVFIAYIAFRDSACNHSLKVFKNPSYDLVM